MSILLLVLALTSLATAATCLLAVLLPLGGIGRQLDHQAVEVSNEPRPTIHILLGDVEAMCCPLVCNFNHDEAGLMSVLDLASSL